jgi:hypothetical protein
MQVDVRKRSAWPLIVLVIVVVTIVSAIWTVLENNGARFIVCMVSHCEHAPAVDQHLASWLSLQPGVVADSIRVFRKDQELHVVFLFDRSFSGRPRVPDIAAKCKSLGYAGSAFRRCPTPVVFPADATHTN